jgi:hypothetical protein
MRSLSLVPAVGAAAVAAVLVGGCTGTKDPHADGSHRPVPTLAKVRLPDDPSALADLATRQIGRMPSVRTTATSSLGGNDVGTISASLGRSGSTPAASLRFEEAPHGTLEIVQGLMIGGTFYMRDLKSDAAPGKPWLRLSTADLDDPRLGKVAGGFKSAVSQIASSVKQATGASDMANIKPGRLTAKPVAQTLDGVRVRRYTGTTELAKLPTGGGSEDVQIIGLLRKAGVTRFPWRLWIDETGLPRKFTVSTKLGKRGTFTAQSTYGNWGASVEVTAPPANQVTGLADAGGH